MGCWINRAKRHAALAVLFVVPLLAQAEDARKGLLRQIHRNLFEQHELCVLNARVALALPQDQAQRRAEVTNDLATCIAQGKADVEKARADIAKWFKGRTAPATLATWRGIWLDAYEAADLRDGDTSQIYLRRAIDTLKHTDKASDKFKAAVLNSP